MGHKAPPTTEHVDSAKGSLDTKRPTVLEGKNARQTVAESTQRSLLNEL